MPCHDSQVQPEVIAHRGGAALRPENTMTAFDHAVALGAGGIELDVRLSRDGIAVVHHDASLDRTTNASGALGARTTLELSGVDAAYRFQPERGYPLRGRGIGVPRFRTVLEHYRDMPLIVELKGRDSALVAAVVGDIRALGAVDRVCVGGFSWSMLRHRAVSRASGRDQRRAGGSQVRAVRVVAWSVPAERALPGVPGARVCRPRPGRVASVCPARSPGRRPRFRSGPWTTRRCAPITRLGSRRCHLGPAGGGAASSRRLVGRSSRRR